MEEYDDFDHVSDTDNDESNDDQDDGIEDDSKSDYVDHARLVPNPTSIRERIDAALETLSNLSLRRKTSKSRSEIVQQLSKSVMLTSFFLYLTQIFL
jgi:hypothetical protein